MTAQPPQPTTTEIKQRLWTNVNRTVEYTGDILTETACCHGRTLFNESRGRKKWTFRCIGCRREFVVVLNGDRLEWYEVRSGR